MTRPYVDWNVGLAEDLRRPGFARGFLITCMEEEGVPLQYALGKVIRALGVKEFSQKVGMAPPNVLRAINRRHNPTQATLDRLLKPFGLRLGLALITPERRRSAGARARRERRAHSHAEA